MTLATEIDFSRAKADLSQVMDDVVIRQRPKVIDRHRGRDRALLIGGETIEAALAGKRFDPQVIVEEGGVTIRLAQFGLLGFGETLDDALADLVRELDDYTDRFLADFGFYSQTKRADHLLHLLRFKMTPPGRRATLLLKDSQQNTAG